MFIELPYSELRSGEPLGLSFHGSSSREATAPNLRSSDITGLLSIARCEEVEHAPCRIAIK